MLAAMLVYAFISLDGVPVEPAVEKASHRLHAWFPGCATRVVDDGRTDDGTPWAEVHFDVPKGTRREAFLRSFFSELKRNGVAFWRLRRRG